MAFLPLEIIPPLSGRTRVVGWLRCPALTGSTGTRHRSEPLLLPEAAAAQCLYEKDVEVARYSPNCQRLTTVPAGNSSSGNKGFPYFREVEFPGSADSAPVRQGNSAGSEPLREVVAGSAEPGRRVVSRRGQQRSVVAERGEHGRFARNRRINLPDR